MSCSAVASHIEEEWTEWEECAYKEFEEDDTEYQYQFFNEETQEWEEEDEDEWEECDEEEDDDEDYDYQYFNEETQEWEEYENKDELVLSKL